MICKTHVAGSPAVKHCQLPAPLATPVNAIRRCPDCDTPYINKWYGTFGSVWTLLKGQSA